MKKIYVECTHTNGSDLNTGIQRVVRNLLIHLPQSAQKEGIEIVPVILHNGEFLPIVSLPMAEHNTISPNIKGAIKNYLKNLYRALRQVLVALIPLRSWEQFLFAPRTQWGLNWTIDHFFIIPLKRVKHSVLSTVEPTPAVEYGDEHNLLLLLDSSWHLQIWGAVDKMRARGIRVFTVTYDLIPITHPHFCDENLVRLFNDWFAQAVKRVEGYIAISHTVEEDLYHYLRTLDSSTLLPRERLTHFFLGADIKKSDVSQSNARNALKKWLEKTPAPYLIVCTIEPRKNHIYLLEVFNRLWARGVDARLMIVGRIGWKVDELIQTIRTHSQFGKRLSMWNDLSDSELAYTYHNAKMLLFPSYVEGFGLPIVESLYFGLPVMASDIPVHREVGQDKIGYFDLDNPDDLVDKIVAIESVSSLPRVDSSQVHIVDWQESAQSLLKEIIRLSGKPHEQF